MTGVRGAKALWIGEIVQRFFKSWIRGRDTVDILDNGLAFGEKAGNGKSHRDAMIAKTGKPRAMQRCAPMNFETVI